MRRIDSSLCSRDWVSGLNAQVTMGGYVSPGRNNYWELSPEGRIVFSALILCISRDKSLLGGRGEYPPISVGSCHL